MQRVAKFIWLLIGVIVVISFVWDWGETPEEKRARLCGQNSAFDADLSSRTFVRSELKSPRSASFPWQGKSEAIGQCVFRVVSYVEAENSFGATIRTYYEAKLRFNPTSKEWSLISLRFED